MRRRVWINLTVFFVMFVVMIGWLTRQVVSFKSLDRPYSLSADFANAFGVLPNAEVTYLGVDIGQVSTVKRIPGGVRIDMSIQRDRKVPEGSDATILRKSAIGEQYIDFSPPAGGANAPAYHAGAHIPIEKTHVPLEFSELLRSASGLISSIPPDSVASILDALSTGLEGRVDSLRSLAESGDKLSAALASRTAALDRLAANGTSLNHVVAEHRGELGQSLTDLRNLADSLRNAKGDTAILLDRGSRLLTDLANVVGDQKANLDCDLKTLERVTDETTTPARLAGLKALLRVGPVAFSRVWDARDVNTDGPSPGVWVRVGFVSNPLVNKPPQFVPAKVLPGVAAVPPCASPLKPVPVGDYRLGPTGALPALPAGGGASLLSVLLGGVAAALVLRQVGVRP